MRLSEAGNLSIGSFGNAVNKLDIKGSVAIGSDYAGAFSAPESGLLVEGQSVFGNNVFDSNGFFQIIGNPQFPATLEITTGVSNLSGPADCYGIKNTSAFNINVSVTSVSSFYNSCTTDVGLSPITNLYCNYNEIVVTDELLSGNNIEYVYGVFVNSSLNPGTVTNAYGAYFNNPSGASVSQAIYSDNMSIGYSSSNPPSNGMIVAGMVSIGADSSTELFNVGTSNQFTVDSSGGINMGSFQVVNQVLVSSTPYVVLDTDFYISVDSSGGARTVQLPNSPTSKRIFVVKDSSGSSGTHNITITTVGGTVLIDGSTTFALNSAYESAQLIFNGTSYEVY